jgi:predicted nucleic acid-binding protein
VNLYVESSAILAWLLDESSAAEVRRLLADAEFIFTSDLALIECSRVLIRAVALGELNEAEAADRRAHLANAAAGWHVLHIASEIIDRAKQPFPEEPIRTLDALHLASALTARAAVTPLEILSLDERVRKSAKKLGFSLLPEKIR